MPSLRSLLLLHALAVSEGLLYRPSRRIKAVSLPRHTDALRAGNNRWWDGDSDNMMSTFFWDKSRKTREQRSSLQKQPSSLITPKMEEEVMASARATMDSNTLSRALSSLIDKSNNGNAYIVTGGESEIGEIEKKGKNSLRDLALRTNRIDINQKGSSSNRISNMDRGERKNQNSWDTHQIAIASGITIFLLSPLVIPIIHSLLPPIIPFPSSVSFTGAALLGTISYIVALGDPTDQTNLISGNTGGGVLGDGVEVGGAVSRIVGRTALESAQASAPRLKAAARAMVDYDSNIAQIEELAIAQQKLSQFETENERLRKEVSLWKAVEDISGMYKLEELKEIARYRGLKGYSSDGKNALLRRLVKEGILTLDITPYL